MLPNHHKAAIHQYIDDNPDKQTPSLFEIENTEYIIKPKRRESGRAWREYASALSVFLLFGKLISPKKLKTDGIKHETRRLKELKQAGITVPEIFIEHDDYIVIEYCGESLEEIIDNTVDKQQVLPFYLPKEELANSKYGHTVDASIVNYLDRIIKNLIQLHTCGQWHGGAQIRNLTLNLKNDTIYRIDFEENTGNAMPLPLAQAYDVMLCFNSLAPFIRNDVAKGVELLNTYLQQTDSHGVKIYLKKIDRLLQRIKKITPLLTKKTKAKSDVINTLYFAEIINQSFKK